MSERETIPAPPGPYDRYLADRLAALRAELPDRPLPYYRMLLIDGMWKQLSLTPKEARETVDDFFHRHNLGIRQPTPLEAVRFALLLSAVLCGVPLLIYWLWHLLHAR